MTPHLERLSRDWADLPLGAPLWWFDSVPSTNDVLKRRAEQGAPEGSVVMAGAQTGGRGRLGRKWFSLPGLGLYLSVLLRPDWRAVDSGLAAFLASLAAVRCLRQLGVLRLTLKWPNDVLADGRKIAGVLVEPRIGGDQIAFIVLGVGINVEHDETALAGVGNGCATSCRLQGCVASVEEVASVLIRELAALYGRVRQRGADILLEEWLANRTLAESSSS